MDRFARSPGSGFNDYTSPGQNACIYADGFEYYYYPLYVEEIKNKLKDAPIIKVGAKYKVINTNIIHINTEEDLSSCNLYNILIKNGISKIVILNFINNILYKDDKQSSKELNLCLLNKVDNEKLKSIENKTFKNLSFFYLIFIAFLIIVLINLRK